MSLRKLVLLVALVGCSSAATETAVAPRAAAKPAIQRAEDAFYGVVTSSESRLVAAEVDGAVKKLLVRPGQFVTAGTTLAVLDDSLIGKQIQEARGSEDAARGQLLQAQGQAAEAGRVYAQLQALLKDGAVARDSVRQASAAAGVAGAAVKVAQGALARAVAQREALEQLRSHATIVAPIDGVISLVKVSEGQLAQRGQPIVRVSNPTGLKLRFAVPREARDRLVAGSQVSVAVKGHDAFKATIRDIGSTLEPPLQFAVVEAELESTPADTASMLGALAEVRVL